MRTYTARISWCALLMALASCEDEQPTALRCISGTCDVVTDMVDAGTCPPFTACLGGVPTEIAEVCLVDALATGATPSAGLYRVCLVDDRGRLLLAVLAGDKTVTHAGWTHSAYGNGLVASTLSADDEARCTEAKRALTSADAGSSVCSGF